MKICESSSAELLREAASFFLDDTYTRITNLENNAHMFSADLVYHHACLSAYIQKYKRAISVKESRAIRVKKKNIFEWLHQLHNKGCYRKWHWNIFKRHP